ncbi:MAG: hypothetical protein V8S24_11245 [Gordonibacter pamelaeae]
MQQGDERRAVGHVGFGEDVLDVGFDGGEADAQPEGDLVVREALGYEQRNVALARREGGEQRVLRKAGWLASGSPWPCSGVTRTVNAQAS